MTVLCVPHLALISQANPTHQRQRMPSAATVGNGVSQQGKVEVVKPQALGGRFQDQVFATRRKRRHG